MNLLLGPVLLGLFLAAAACVVTAEVVAMTSLVRRDLVRHVFDPAAVVLVAVSLVLFVLRLRHYS